MITATAAIGIATTVDDLKGVTTGTTAATTKAVTNQSFCDGPDPDP
jgi:hypothetical protein